MDTRIMILGVVRGTDVRMLDKYIVLKSWVQAYDTLRRVIMFEENIVSIARNGGRKYALVGRSNAFGGGLLAPKNKACRDAVRLAISVAQHYPTLEAAIAAHILTYGRDDVPL